MNKYQKLNDIMETLKAKRAEKNEKSWSGSMGSGSDSSEESYGSGEAAWNQYVMDTCGVDLTDAWSKIGEKVAAADFQSIIARARGLTQNFVAAVQDHEVGLDTLETQLADPDNDLDAFLAQHGALTERFAATFTTLYGMGFCAMVELEPLRTRMEVSGLIGFATDAKCNRVGVYLGSLYFANHFDESAVAASVFSDLEGVGSKLRDDIRCLIKDIRDFKDFVEQVQIDPTETSARQAILAVDAITGYMTDIGDDATNLLASASDIARLTGYDAAKRVNLDKEAQKKRNELLSKVKKLVHTLRSFR